MRQCKKAMIWCCGTLKAAKLLALRSLGPLIRALEIFLGHASPCLMDLFTPNICGRCLNIYRSYLTTTR
jgi:hypothetical protein